MAASCAGEICEPNRVFPQALAMCVVLSTLSYLVPVGLALCTPAGILESNWVDGFMITGVAPAVGGTRFGIAAGACAASSAFGMATCAILVGSREIQFMADNGQLPQVCFLPGTVLTGSAGVEIH